MQLVPAQVDELVRKHIVDLCKQPRHERVRLVGGGVNGPDGTFDGTSVLVTRAFNLGVPEPGKRVP